MSNIQYYRTAGGGGGTVTSVTGENGIIAIPTTGDVVIRPALSGLGTSTNGSTADLVTFGMGATPQVVRFYIYITGRDTSTGDGVGYTIFASARTDGAAATVIATAFIDADEDTSLEDCEADVVSSGNNVVIQVTGVTGQTIAYKCVGYYLGV